MLPASTPLSCNSLSVPCQRRPFGLGSPWRCHQKGSHFSFSATAPSFSKTSCTSATRISLPTCMVSAPSSAPALCSARMALSSALESKRSRLVLDPPVPPRRRMLKRARRHLVARRCLRLRALVLDVGMRQRLGRRVVVVCGQEPASDGLAERPCRFRQRGAGQCDQRFHPKRTEA